MSNLDNGRRLYRQMHPLPEAPAGEFEHMTDTGTNRGRLAYVIARGGQRAEDARAKLAEWDAAKAEDTTTTTGTSLSDELGAFLHGREPEPTDVTPGGAAA